MLVQHGWPRPGLQLQAPSCSQRPHCHHQRVTATCPCTGAQLSPALPPRALGAQPSPLHPPGSPRVALVPRNQLSTQRFPWGPAAPPCSSHWNLTNNHSSRSGSCTGGVLGLVLG